MKILFDAFWWPVGPASNRLVLRDIITAWSETFPDDEMVLALPSSWEGRVRDLPEAASVVNTSSGQHALASIFELPILARRERADVVLAHNFTPLSGPSATFIHDVMFQTDPEWFTRPERIYFTAIPLLASRARVVLTSSEAEAQRIRAENPRLTQVSAIGLAVGTNLLSAKPSRPDIPTGPLGGTAPEGFLLSVGRLNVRKNLAASLEAAAISGAITERFPLLVVGEPDGRGEDLPAVVRAAVDDASIIFLGRVSDDELAWLYSNAAGLVFMSRGEGFGLPQIEARHFGCPLLLSDLPVFREVSGEHALYADPSRVEDIARGIRELVRTGRSAPRPLALPAWDEVVSNARKAIVESLD